MKNKSYIMIIIFIIAIAIISVLFYKEYISNKRKANKEALDFKQEYESLNNTKDNNGNIQYINISFPEKNPFRYATIDEIFNFLSKGTGILYFGMPECNWCRTMLPVLLDAANTEGIKEILYYNPKQIRKDNTEEYQRLVAMLNDYLSTDTTTQKETDENFDSTKKRLYMPDVYFIKNGKIVGNHMDTLDSQKDAKTPLTVEQYTELKTIFTDLISKIKNESCNDKGC
jgi:thiol-disulfide isomerase/thioredoxin